MIIGTKKNRRRSPWFPRSSVGTRGIFRTRRFRGKEEGFTLIELLISLTILGIVVVILFGSLRIGVRAWEKGEEKAETQQRLRIVLDLLKRQLSSAWDYKIEEGDLKSYVFKGGERSLTFTSRVSVVPSSRGGLVYVQYEVEEDPETEGQRLLVYEKNAAIAQKDGELVEPEKEDFHQLVGNMENIEFEYLESPQKESENPEWQKTWDPETDDGLPAAVRVIWKPKEQDHPLFVIARIPLRKRE